MGYKMKRKLAWVFFIAGIGLFIYSWPMKLISAYLGLALVFVSVILVRSK